MFTVPPTQIQAPPPVALPSVAPAPLMAPPQNGQDPNLANALSKMGGSGSGSGSDSSSLGGAGKSSLGGNQSQADKAQAAAEDANTKANDANHTEPYQNTAAGGFQEDPARYDDAGNLLPAGQYKPGSAGSGDTHGANAESYPGSPGAGDNVDGQGSAMTPPVQDAGLLGPSGDPGQENNGLGDGIGGIIDNVVAGGYGNDTGYGDLGPSGDPGSGDYSGGGSSGGDSGNTYGGADNTGDGSGD